MAPEEKTQPEAEVKPARKPRTPRKKAAATPNGGDAGAPAASAEAVAPAPAKKTRAPRKKTNKPAAETPVAAEAAAPAPVEKPEEKPAPAAVAEKAALPEQQKPRKERFNNNRQKQNKPHHKSQQPAAEVVAPEEKHVEKAAEQHGSDIENPDAAPQLPPAPGFAAPETVGGGEGNSGGNRRKRRRNRNRNRENGPQPQQPQATPQVDPQELVRRAWKIFLGEVTEEGLALMDDRTAAEASRRAFRVAELFLIEAARHRPSTAPVVDEAPEELEADDAAEDMPQA